MDGNRLGGIIRYLRRVTEAGAEGTSDGQLLQRFAAQRDEAAFVTLVDRHGPMVLGVCRRVLRDPHDAEDAFQATFLVLAHKARSIGRPQAVASWLFSTARRTALRARFRKDRRRARESVLDDLPAPETTEGLAWHELRPALDEEVGRLPRKYRDAVVLCYLQEKTYAEAAKTLGLAAGTVSSRLARARDILRKRLLRRGLTLSSSLLVGILSQQALSAAVPGALRDATTAAALRLAAGQALSAAATGPVAALTKGVLRAMFLTKLTTIGVVLLLGVVCAGSTVLLHDGLAGDGQRPAPAGKVASNDPPPVGDQADRWLQAARRPNLPARQKSAYEQLAKLRHSEYPQLTNWGTLLIPPDPADPLNALSRMGLDVLPQLAEALDDQTPTRTVTTDGRGVKKEWRVNDLVARLIASIAEREFTIQKEPGTFPPRTPRPGPARHPRAEHPAGRAGGFQESGPRLVREQPREKPGRTQDRRHERPLEPHPGRPLARRAQERRRPAGDRTAGGRRAGRVAGAEAGPLPDVGGDRLLRRGPGENRGQGEPAESPRDL
jgi:RNA polymerase sigma factor (sigma-70 family)